MSADEFSRGGSLFRRRQTTTNVSTPVMQLVKYLSNRQIQETGVVYFVAVKLTS